MYQSVAPWYKKRHSPSHQILEKKNSRLQMVGWKNGKINVTSRKKTVAVEEGDVSEITVSSWTERVKELTLNYAPQDVWNMDESGAFWKALPERSLTEKRK